MKKISKKKILVCLSGGVDSSVAAALLVRAGYEVTGAFMVNYDNNGDPGCWLPEYRDAVRVAAALGIPIVRWDFTKEYRRDVLNYMYREYRAGRTPNPDVLCNKYIKFDAWLKKAQAAGFAYIATGHYARVKSQESGIKLLTAQDKKKDQTYFLHQLNQEQLSHVLFPIGDLLKSEVRALAKKYRLLTATKAESMGICFVGEVPMKDFLQKKIAVKPGAIMLTTGEVIGEHDGLAFYTIGQRHHLGSQELRVKSQDGPLYVVDRNVKKNILLVGPKDDPGLLKKEIVLREVHWIRGQAPEFPLKCEVRFRHQQPLQRCTVKRHELRGKNQGAVVICAKAQWAVTPGQFAVLYHNGECLGGGIVK